MGDTVKVKLIRTHVVGRPGEIVIAFGHKFEIQPNGDAVCDMHKDFIPTEVKARRVEVIEPGNARPNEIIPELSGFTMDVADYFGKGNIDRLMNELARLRKDLLQEFVLSRFSIEIPSNIANHDILKQIRNLCERATGKTILKISKETNNNDTPSTTDILTGDTPTESKEDQEQKIPAKKSSKTQKN